MAVPGGRVRLAAAVGVAAAGLTISPVQANADPNPSQPYSQGCVGSLEDSGPGQIAWPKLRNPVLSYDDSAVRDIGVRLLHGRWHLLFTSATGNEPTWRIAATTTTDFSRWTSQAVWPPQAGVHGVASPDITRRPDGTYVVTYESNPWEATAADEDKIYYRTSPDLTNWSVPKRLMPTIHPAAIERVIDPALAWTKHGLFLGYKFGLRGGRQHFEIAWSPTSSLDGPWFYVGRPDISVYHDTIENYEFLEIDGVWHLLATSNTLDRPWLFRLQGNPAQPSGWLNWSRGRELEVPLEKWNRGVGVPGVNFDQENSAYLCDARRIDGFFYLLYIGSTELKSYGHWGHTRMGIARSKDLVRWAVPCGPRAVSTPVGCG